MCKHVVCTCKSARMRDEKASEAREGSVMPVDLSRTGSSSSIHSQAAASSNGGSGAWVDPGEREPLVIILGEQGEAQRLRQAEVCAPTASGNRNTHPFLGAGRDRGRPGFCYLPSSLPSFSCLDRVICSLTEFAHAASTCLLLKLNKNIRMQKTSLRSSRTRES